MADKDNKYKGREYHRMSPEELIEEAKQIREIDNLEERVEKTRWILAGRNKNLLADRGARELRFKIDHGKLHDIAEDLYKEWKERAENQGKDLKMGKEEEFKKKMIDLVAPALYYGVEGKTQDNYEHMRDLLERIEIKEQGEKIPAWAKFSYLVKTGRGHEAYEFLIGQLQELRRKRDERNFSEHLIQSGDYQGDFAHAARYYIANEMNKRAIEEKLPYEVVPSDIVDIGKGFLDLVEGGTGHIKSYAHETRKSTKDVKTDYSHKKAA